MSSTDLLVFVVVLALAYANGANDNFKGVATLYGSGTSNYRTALLWATVTTLAGSLVAAFFAESLISAFSGKGLVPNAALADPAFIVAVALGAAVTVLATALAGVPISTTHSLTGALAGAALLASGANLHLDTLGKNFFLPLALSPVLAMLLVMGLYPALRWLATRYRLREDSCICLTSHAVTGAGGPQAGAAFLSQEMDIHQGDARSCPPGPPADSSVLLKVELTPVLRRIHFLSAGAVSFARGTNDAPKILGVALAAQAFELHVSTVVIAVAMALGGLLHSRRIARTIAKRILPFNESEGTLANLITSCLVIFASHLGLPVSTTHVSVSSLFGLGAAKGRAHWGVVSAIAFAWILTLPVSAIAAAAVYLAVAHPS